MQNLSRETCLELTVYRFGNNFKSKIEIRGNGWKAVDYIRSALDGELCEHYIAIPVYIRGRGNWQAMRIVCSQISAPWDGLVV